MNFFLKRDTGYLFCSTKQNFFKIPYKLNSFLNLKRENENIKSARQNYFFKDYVEESRNFFIFKKIKKYQNFSEKKNKNFINKYLKEFFKKKEKLKKKKL